jgi:hypothetical protein
VWTVLVALAAAMAGSEIALRGTKLQTGLARVLVVWAAVYVLAVYRLANDGNVAAVPFTVFWGGAFLTWFGVRSHLESSILLRMLVLLRRRPMTEAEIVSAYTSHCGEAARVEELCRGGLVRRERNTLAVTAKGQTVLDIVGRLR